MNTHRGADAHRPGIVTGLLGAGRPERVPSPGGTTFCALCWGAGAIHRPAANGEGLVPVACDHCGGTGRV